METLIKKINYVCYTSSNTNIFYYNFSFWFVIKLMFSLYYGINFYLILTGFSCWSLWEYIYHRFAMHGLKNTAYYKKLHGNHHLNPLKTAHIPVFQYILVAPVFFISSYFMNASYVYSYSVGHLCGLYCFEIMHFVIHNDKNREKIYTKYHLYHHKYPHMAYCFTTPCFDIMFSTFPDNNFSYNILGMLPIPYISFYGIKETA